MTTESPLVDPSLLVAANSAGTTPKPETSPTKISQPSASGANGGTAAAATAAELDDADAFDANEYVRDLIARMGGDVEQQQPTLPPPVVAKKVPAPAANETEKTMVLDAPSQLKELVEAARQESNAAESVEPQEPVEPRRRHAPELLSDLQQLREAANLTTSNALHTFDCKSLVLRSYTSLLMACVAITLCTALLSLSERPFSFAHTAAILMFLFGAIATWRYSAATSVLWRKLSR